MIMSLEDRDT